MLVHLPNGYKPEQVAPALTAKIKTLPKLLRGSLTWDQGVEMRDWKQVAVAADIAIFFCDPHSPWQRATNENTNGLLRQYFPKGTDLSVHTAAHLDLVADELNDRPRKRLAFRKPDRTDRTAPVALTARIRRSACGNWLAVMGQERQNAEYAYVKGYRLGVEKTHTDPPVLARCNSD
jgi:transposase InsO family protein